MLATLFWSGNFIAGRALRHHIDPVTLNFVRWLIALVLFVPLVWHNLQKCVPVMRREWRLIFGLGATGIAAFHTLTYPALQKTTATNALLMLALTPIAILTGASVSRREWPDWRQSAGSLVSIFGAAVLLTRGDFTAIHVGDDVVGELWMLAAIVVWAAYSLLLRQRPVDLPQDVALAASVAVALVLLLPLLFFSSVNLAAFKSPAALAGIGYIAVFASVIGFLLWSYGVSRLGPVRSGVFINLMPVFGAALAVTLLGETLALSQIAGGVIVLSGIVLVEWGQSRASGQH